MLNTPVSIIFFNRPDTLKKLFKVIQQIKPKTLLLIQDGARKSQVREDQKKILECRKVFEKINWKCDVYTNYSEINLGCGLRPATGIDWVFKQVDRSIILEDDCIPELSFFQFCEELLEKYKDDDRIMLISGMNLLETYETKYSYLFSQGCTIGAWATWKRVWENYDFSMEEFDNKVNRKILRKNIINSKMRISKFSSWDITRRKLKNGENVNWWDYQFHFQLLLKNGLGIVPKKNLVHNIGYGKNATNVSDQSATHFNLKTFAIEFPLIHSDKVECDKNFDSELFDKQFKNVSKIKVALSYLKRRIKYGRL